MSPKIRQTEKRRLVESVDFLSRSLGRPVCSKDLIVFWGERPEMRPILLQAVGQTLIKATRKAPDGWGRVRKIGIIGNLAYYAMDAGLAWRRALDGHRARLGLQKAIREEMPVLAQNLLDTPFADVARNALAGWHQEWVLGSQKFPQLAKAFTLRLSPLAGIAEEHMASKHLPVPLGNPITRREAEVLLRSEYSRRLEWVDGERLSPNKHLVRLKHPRSALLPTLGFFEAEVRLYCQARWPIGEDDQTEARSLFAVLSYGSSKNFTDRHFNSVS